MTKDDESKDHRLGGKPSGTGGKPRAHVKAQDPRLSRVPFARVLDAAEARGKEYKPIDGLAFRKGGALTIMRKLRPYWDRYTVGQYDEATRDGYYEFRTAQDNDNVAKDGERRKVSTARAKSELNLLRAATHEYQAAHGLIGDVSWGLYSAPAATVNWLERDQAARILFAIRGRRWDAGAWAVDRTGHRIVSPRKLYRLRAWNADEKRWERLKSLREKPVMVFECDWITRLVLLLLYTGSTSPCAFRLRWDGRPDCGWSYVDLDTEIEGRVGHLYRLGPDTASASMAGIPVALSRRMATHLKRWREMDRVHGFTHVLHRSAHGRHDSSPEAMTSLNSAALSEVWRHAGLQGECNLKILRDTAAIWMIRSGMRRVGAAKTFVPARAIMRSAAFTIGQSYDAFVERFKSEAPDFHKAQIEALRSLAETVR